MLRIPVLPTLLLAATLALTTACEDAPNYPNEPSIEFKSIRAERAVPSTPGETAWNNIFVTIGYKDGDGDLGLSQADIKVAPFNTPPYDKNYYIKTFVYNPGTRQFERKTNFDAFFQRMLTEDQKPQPIRGDLTFQINKGIGFTITDPDYLPGNRVKFEIQIVDRALHKSNVITTDELVLP